MFSLIIVSRIAAFFNTNGKLCSYSVLFELKYLIFCAILFKKNIRRYYA